MGDWLHGSHLTLYVQGRMGREDRAVHQAE